MLAPRRSPGCRCTAQGWLVPTGQSKRTSPGSLCPSAPSPRPQALVPWRCGGAAVGQPTVVARQGRQDTGRGLLPAAPGPGDATASQGGSPVRGMWGLCPPPSPRPQPNSPNSPSGCRPQPHRPPAPCMYSYLQMYRVLSGWERPCPSGRPAMLEGLGTRGRRAAPAARQHARAAWDTTPSPFLVSLDEVWGSG